MESNHARESKMQLEVGKKYVDRRGRVFGPIVKNGDFFDEIPEGHLWNSSGMCFVFRYSEIDLIAEYIEEQNIESKQGE